MIKKIFKGAVIILVILVGLAMCSGPTEETYSEQIEGNIEQVNTSMRVINMHVEDFNKGKMDAKKTASKVELAKRKIFQELENLPEQDGKATNLTRKLINYGYDWAGNIQYFFEAGDDSVVEKNEELTIKMAQTILEIEKELENIEN